MTTFWPTDRRRPHESVTDWCRRLDTYPPPAAAVTPDVPVPACPRCGSRSWRAVTAVEIRVHVDQRGITNVELHEPTPMDGELDFVCAGCDEKLLNWRARTDDDAWKAHHDERRCAWDAFNDLIVELPLPAPATWGAP